MGVSSAIYFDVFDAQRNIQIRRCGALPNILVQINRAQYSPSWRHFLSACLMISQLVTCIMMTSVIKWKTQNRRVAQGRACRRRLSSWMREQSWFPISRWGLLMEVQLDDLRCWWWGVDAFILFCGKICVAGVTNPEGNGNEPVTKCTTTLHNMNSIHRSWKYTFRQLDLSELNFDEEIVTI